MIHPDTIVQPVDPEIGLGLFATRRIPAGTIVWVQDPLDQSVDDEAVSALDEQVRAQFFRYAFVEGGRWLLPWDHTRYTNHACEPSCMGGGYAIDVAIRDIEAGEEITNDYAALGMKHPFQCRCGLPRCRGWVDRVQAPALARGWDALFVPAFARIGDVHQPLWGLLTDPDEITQALVDPSEVRTYADTHCGPGPGFLPTAGPLGLRH